MTKIRGVGVGVAAAIIALFAVTASALAFGLSDEDYDYLRTTQHVERYEAPVLNLSPKERWRLHHLITDRQTADDQIARDKNVRDELAIILEHQLWEKAHPGKFWDARKD